MFRHILLVSLSVLSVSSSPNCTVLEHRASKFDKNPSSEVVTCRNVPTNLIINNFHFVAKNHPQDLVIGESTIPAVANYSSLLNMRHVRRLHLKGLGIKTVVPGAFRNMENLEELDLSHNRLTEIPDGAFAGLKNLRLLDLTANNISVYSENAFKDLEKLDFVEISGNPVRDISGNSLPENVKVKAD